MPKITQLLPTDIIAVEVPKESYQYEKENVADENWHQLIYHIDNDDEESGFYGECEAHQIDIGFDFEIIGEATETEINADYKKFPETLLTGKEASILLDENDNIDLRKLLKANGLYWVNPYNPVILDNEEEQDDLSGVILALHNQWQEAESKVIKGKLVILKKV